MKTSLRKKSSLPIGSIILVVILIVLVYMIFTIFSNFETPLTQTKYIEQGTQYATLTNGNNLVSYSNTFLGMPYLWGGTTPAIFDTTGKYLGGGFDCSGFVQYIYKNFNINLPRTSMEQINEGTSVNINNLYSGDLVFFKTNPAVPSEISHVGIYIGNNKFIHSPKDTDVIKTSELTGYYKDNFVIGKRLIKK